MKNEEMAQRKLRKQIEETQEKIPRQKRQKGRMWGRRGTWVGC